MGGGAAADFCFLDISSVKCTEGRCVDEAPTSFDLPTLLALETAKVGLWPVWVKQWLLGHQDPVIFLATHVVVTWVTPVQVAWLIRRGWQMSHVRQGPRKAENSDRYGRPESARGVAGIEDTGGFVSRRREALETKVESEQRLCCSARSLAGPVKATQPIF